MSVSAKTWKKPSVPKDTQTNEVLYHQIHTYFLFLWEDIPLGIKLNTLKVHSYKMHYFTINIPTISALLILYEIEATEV